jgi:hypothetical protein
VRRTHSNFHFFAARVEEDRPAAPTFATISNNKQPTSFPTSSSTSPVTTSDALASLTGGMSHGLAYCMLFAYLYVRLLVSELVVVEAEEVEVGAVVIVV